MSRFDGVGAIKNQAVYDSEKLDIFSSGVQALKKQGRWEKQAILDLFFVLLPEFAHRETGKYLDQRM